MAAPLPQPARSTLVDVVDVRAAAYAISVYRAWRFS